MPIPQAFTKDGVLAPGTYPATFSDIRSSILVNGNSSPTWDKVWRDHLLTQAEILVKQLWSVGIDDVYLDGSFVEDKEHPNDIDGYFDPHLSAMNSTDMTAFGGMVSKLNNIDPHKIWIWDHRSRKQVNGFGKKQLPMWIFYRVELYPHLNTGSGILDQFGNDQTFPAAFRQSRHNFIPKGIVKVVP